MNLLNRLFKIGQSEAHAAVNQLEDPIKLTEQGLRDLRQDLDKSLHGLAEVKAMSIRARNEAEAFRATAADYENKAVLLLQNAHRGELAPAEADRLAGEALLKKADNDAHAARAATDQQKFELSVAQMDQNVTSLKTTISQWENELKTLKARVTVSQATLTINKQLARLDSSGTVALLERMKEKVAVQEALAESYGDLARQGKSVDAEINQALSTAGPARAAADLRALKARLGLGE